MDARALIEQLQALELSQVAVTATIEPAGRLGAVGGLWPKLLAASKEAAQLGLLRIVVVAADQSDIAPELLAPEAAPLRVLKAATLREAIQQLYEEHGPREAVRRHERARCAHLDLLGRPAPLDLHYQALPLLREVKRERLPRTAGTPHAAPKREEREEELGKLHEVDLLRWEEELREERVAYEPASLMDLLHQFRSVVKDAKNEVPRFVVLGPPGSGKTTLAQYLGWQAANGAVQVAGRSLLPARIRLRDWEAWAAKEHAPEQSLAAYLASLYQALSPAPSAAHWSSWLQRGEVLLLLDGLDEIEGKPFFLSILKIAFMTFSNCPMLITCRTVSFEQHKAVCPDFPLFTLAGLTADQQRAYIKAFPAEHGGDYKHEVLIEQLERTPQLLPLAANPLLLSVMCYVMDGERSGLLPATRSALYTKALEKLLLSRSQRTAVRYPGEEPGVDEKLAITQRAALHLFLLDTHRLLFTGQVLGQALQQAFSEEGYGTVAAPWANALRADLVQNSGILRRHAEYGFFFLHLTVQELLVARALAHTINHQGWDAPIIISGQHVTLRRLVDHKAWDPRWQEVILLLAGQLTNPVPLLQLVMNEKKDDFFRSRLALAAHCLSEAQQPDNAVLSALTDRLTAAACQRWLQHARASTIAAVQPLSRALPTLGQRNGHIDGIPLLQWFCQRLRHGESAVRTEAAEALGSIGEAIAQHPDVISALAAALQDPEVAVRAEVTEAFGRVREAVARHQDALSALAYAARHDADGAIRFGAIRALRQMGEAAARHPEVHSVLTPILDEEQQRKFNHATTNESKTETATTQLSSTLPALVATLRNGDSHSRAQAAHEIGKMGNGAMQHPDALSALLEIALHDRDAGVRARATDALGSLGPAITQRSEALPTLIVALRDRDGGVRAQAAKALGRLGETAARSPDVLPVLVQALRDENGNVRYRAAEALAQFMRQGVRIFRRWWGKVEGKRVEELANPWRL